MPDPLSLITDPFWPAPGPRPGESGTLPTSTGFGANPVERRPSSLIGDPHESERLQDAARRAPATSPDRAARVLKAQRLTGFPSDLIDRNLDEIEAQTAAADFDVDRYRANSPILSRWLSDNPQHMALAQDDLRPLAALERTLQMGSNAARAPGAGVYAAITEVPWAGIEAAGDVLEFLTGNPQLRNYARSVRQASLETTSRIEGPQTGAGVTERAVYSGLRSLGQMVPAAAAGVLTGGSSTMLGVMGTSVSLTEYGRARDEGASGPRAALFGLNQGGIEVLTERIPARLLFGDLAKRTGFLTTMFRQVAAEVPTEQAATFLQDLSEWTTLHPEAPIAQFAAERPSAAYQTLIATVVAAGGQTALVSALERAAGKPTSQMVLEELGDAARQSKTLGRDPDAVGAFIDQATAGGSLASVLLPVETFTQYWQSKGQDPAAMAARLTGDATAYAQSLQTGEDLAVPMSAYVRHIAASEHNGYFSREARFAPDALNAREQQALEQAADVEVTAATETPDMDVSAAAVGDRVASMLEQIGVEPTTARQYGTIYKQGFGSLGERAGIDPLQLFERYGLQVSREGFETPETAPLAEVGEAEGVEPDVSESAARPGETSVQRERRRAEHYADVLAAVLRDARQVDPTVDPEVITAEFGFRRAMHEEGQQNVRDAGGDPIDLLRAIAKAGGLGPESAGGLTGELRWLKEGTRGGVAQGVAGVFRKRRTLDDRGAPKTGLGFDVMLQRLQQDPRFAWIEDTGQLINAIDDAMRGSSETDTFPGTADLRTALGIQPGTAWWKQAQRAPATETEFSQGPLQARHDRLVERIRVARAKGKNDLQASFELQDVLDELAGLTSPAGLPAAVVDPRGDPSSPDFFRQPRRGFIRFGNRQVRIELLKRADLSTFLHESAHLYLEVLGDVVDELGRLDVATRTDAQRKVSADYGALLQWLGVENRADIKEAQHEQFARGFEAYLREGQAPTVELRAAFARFRAWLVSLYRSVRDLHVDLTPEVRKVFDRLLATDAAIEAAERDAGRAPLFTDEIAAAAGLTSQDLADYRARMQTASDQARETVQAQLLRQLQRERAAWWRQERVVLRAALTPEIAEQPIYRALALLQRGTRPDGSRLPEGVDAFKLSSAALVAQFGPDILQRLPRPLVYAKTGGVPPSVAAELLGFPSARALVEALVASPPIERAIDAAVDARMRERHGDLLLDGTLADVAQAAVLDAGAEVFAAELQQLEALARRTGSRVTVPPVRTLRAMAEQRIAGMKVKDLRPGTFAAAARRAGQRALQAASRQDFAGALQAKQQQVLNVELHRAAAAAVETVDTARVSFQPVFGRDASLASRYNFDLVAAARALLVQFELAPRLPGAADTVWSYLEQVRKYDKDTYEDLTAAIEAASQPAQPYRDLTLEQFIGLRDAVLSLWHVARRSQQIVIEGKARDLAEVRGELEAGLAAVSTPTAKRGYARKVSRWENSKLTLMGWRAWFRRAESWVDGVDGGDPRGAFRRLLFAPISEAASRYRVAKRTALERYLSIVQAVEPSLTPEDIDAREIGYVFSGKAELLHALLHTGNASNLSKLLRGRHWGVDREDGTLDSSRWDTFIRRLWREGTLTKADYDYVQAVWDLLEEQKPEAQRVHHDLYGYYFAEVTAHEVQTPFGTYRGGYMPAIVDVVIAPDAAQRADREALEQTPNSFMFPTTGRGFTKGRIEPYARPLALDLRVVPTHLDKVLRFIHLEPSVKGAGRLLIHQGFRRTLDTFDPAVAGELLVPWLQRAARQNVDTPNQGHGGRGADKVLRYLRRTAGMQIMVGNVLNTLQQFTGVFVAGLKVQPRYLAGAMGRFVRRPRRMAADIAEKSVFMQTRTSTQVIEVQGHLDDLLLNPNSYEQARAFMMKHGYILQASAQNVVDLIAWSGAYDQAIVEGATEPEAVSQADSAVRLTQGSFNPEDLSAFETGSPWVRAFTMFYSYWNMLANTLGSEFQIVAQGVGLRKGAGRLFYVYLFGFLLPVLLSDAIVRAGTGEDWDEDEDGETGIDDLLWWVVGAQRRGAAAFLPGVGQAVNAGINAFNDKWYDDRISVSPVVSLLESAVRAPFAIYRSIAEGDVQRRDVRDVLTLIGLMTGLPAGAVARPLGYAADVASGDVEPTGPVDAARGLVVGR